MVETCRNKMKQRNFRNGQVMSGDSLGWPSCQPLGPDLHGPRHLISSVPPGMVLVLMRWCKSPAKWSNLSQKVMPTIS